MTAAFRIAAWIDMRFGGSIGRVASVWALVGVMGWSASILEAGPNQPTAGPEATTWLGGERRITWTSAECLSCHRVEQPTFSHPQDVRPSFAIADEFPLENGRITCTTCHLDDADSHANSRTIKDSLLRSGRAGGLRSPGGSDFCAQCHGGTASRPRDLHAMALGRAHLSWQNRREGATTFTALGDRETGGESSRQCLECHDGTMGNSLGNSHPVNVRYEESAMSRRSERSRLIPVADLDPRIRLFNGRVECGSCHNPYSRLPKMLTMVNDHSSLCVSCHDWQR